MTESGRARWVAVALVGLLALVVGGGVFAVLSGPVAQVPSAPVDDEPGWRPTASEAPRAVSHRTASQPEQSEPEPEPRHEPEERRLDPSAAADGSDAGRVSVATLDGAGGWPEFKPTTPPPHEIARGDVRAYQRDAAGARGGTGSDSADLLPATLLVRVFAAESGERLPEASVEVLHGEGERSHLPRSPEGASFDDLRDGPLDVRVRHAGRVPRHVTSLVAQPGRELLLDVRLEPGRTFHGIVSRDKHDVVPGADLRAWPAEVWWGAWPLGGLPVTLLAGTSDRDGRVTIDALPRKQPLVFEVTGDGVEPRRFAYDPGIRTDDVFDRVIVTPGRHVAGRVLDADGKPVGGAIVYAARRLDVDGVLSASLEDFTAREQFEAMFASRLLRWSRDRRHLVLTGARVRTDESGRFATQVTALRTGVLLALHPDFGTSEPLEVTGWDERLADRYLELRLRGHGRATVRVMDAAGAPVRGARVSLPTSMLTGHLPELEPGLYGPVREHAGISLAHITHPAHLGSVFVGRAARDTHIDWRAKLEPGFQLTGRVVGASGRSLEDARVSCAGQSAVTGANGRFELGALPEGPALVRVEAVGHAPVERTVQVPGDESEIALGATRPVEVGLSLPPGAPQPTWILAGAEAGDVRTPVVEQLGFGDGRILFEHVPARHAWIRVVADGYRVAEIQVPDWDGRESRQVLEVELERADVLEGHVLDDRDNPVAGAVVVLRLTADIPLLASRTLRTDQDGAFRFEVPTRYMRNYMLELVDPAYTSEGLMVGEYGDEPTPRLAVPGHPVVLRARSRSVYRIQTVGPSGEPLGDVRIAWEGGFARTDHSGRADLLLDRRPMKLRLWYQRSLQDSLLATWTASDRLTTDRITIQLHEP